jgi:channel protein (hemolysin III family)
MNIIAIPGFSEPVSCWTHLLAAGAAAVGMFFFYRRGRGNGWRIFSLSIFTFSLIFLYSMSGVYHLLDPQGVPRAVLQRLDHAAIWVLIAGTFTPTHTILFRGAWRWGILLSVWAIAITGLVLEVVFFEQFPEWLSLSLFLGLGWIGLLTAYKFRKSFQHPSLTLLIWGGILYSLGAVVDFYRWPNLWPGVVGAHEIFHLFVVAASVCHWLFIYEWCAHPIRDRITFHVRTFPAADLLAHAVGEHLIVQASSLEELKVKIRHTVALRYHKSISPIIHLKYFEEEHL